MGVSRCSLGVFLKGTCSCRWPYLQSIIDTIKTKQLPIKISAVISNRPDAYGLVRAKKANLPAIIVNHNEFPSKQAFDSALMSCIDEYGPDLIILAGFMRILTPEFVTHYPQRILNLHPALLPKYRGLNTHKRVLAEKETEHGASIHIVTEALDSGPIIAQSICKVVPDDTAKTLHDKEYQLELALYPEVIRWFAEGRVQITSQGDVILDGIKLPKTGFRFLQHSDNAQFIGHK